MQEYRFEIKCWDPSSSPGPATDIHKPPINPYQVRHSCTLLPPSSRVSRRANRAAMLTRPRTSWALSSSSSMPEKMVAGGKRHILAPFVGIRLC